MIESEMSYKVNNVYINLLKLIHLKNMVFEIITLKIDVTKI